MKDRFNFLFELSDNKMVTDKPLNCITYINILGIIYYILYYYYLDTYLFLVYFVEYNISEKCIKDMLFLSTITFNYKRSGDD